MKKILAISFCCLLIQPLSAQQNIQAVEKKGIVYKKDFSLGGRLYTQGWSLYADIGRMMSVSKRKTYQIELIELRHPKQDKQSSDVSPGFLNSPKPFFFGKQNTFFAIHASYGFRKIIGEKAEKSGVEVSYSYLIGPSLGFLKPYYLYIKYKTSGSENYFTRAEKYTPGNAAFLDVYSIYGAAGFFHGIGETKIMPGVHGKLGFHFDWARDDDAIKEIELGIALDAYLKKVPIMIIAGNQQLFPTLYGGIQFGRRK
jgi:hypothetical protein